MDRPSPRGCALRLRGHAQCRAPGPAGQDARSDAGLPGAVIAHHVPPLGFGRDEAAFRRTVDFVVDQPARFCVFACGMPRQELLGRRCLVQSPPILTLLLQERARLRQRRTGPARPS